jgi:hypothetical protein
LTQLYVPVSCQVEVERQYQQLCESWRQELEEKQRQFDEARAQILQPRCGQRPKLAESRARDNKQSITNPFALRRDLEMLRLKVLEEVEAPFKQKCHSIAKVAPLPSSPPVPARKISGIF